MENLQNNPAISSSTIQLIECPRDAMQGWAKPIATQVKIEYINTLLQVGFHTIDFGSFVSPKAIPQMADTKEVVQKLKLHNSSTSLLAIIANARGAEDALVYNEIAYLGFPFSISETFQQRNTKSTMQQSFATVEAIQAMCEQKGKKLVIYLSMGFGNPYGDAYTEDILATWTGRMIDTGISIISLADTVGVATPSQISRALKNIQPAFSSATIGVHLHAGPQDWEAKLAAAVDAGCERIDGALKGIGGCPMAGNELVGNMNTELIIDYLQRHGHSLHLNEEALQKSLFLAAKIFA